MTSFDPIAATAGGVLIGVAALMIMLCYGRIAGISGISRAVLLSPALDWRAAFLVGLILSALVFSFVAPDPLQVTGNPLLLIVGGLAVGVGTSIGSGCTSGHGVCGISRRSQRSILATAIFMIVAVITVFVMRQILGVGGLS